MLIRGITNRILTRRTGKNAQAYMMDFVLAITIFVFCLLIYYKTAPNIQINAIDSYEDAYLDIKTLASAIISDGSPNDWTDANVVRIGIMNANVVSEEKVWKFRNMSVDNYQGTKGLLGIRSDYVIYFMDKNSKYLNINGSGLIGHSSVAKVAGLDITNVSDIDAENRVKIERILFYNESPIKMVIYTWN